MKLLNRILLYLSSPKQLIRTINPVSRMGLRVLFQEQPAWVGYSLATALSFFYLLYLFPLNFLMGHGGFFEHGNALLSVSGGWAFLKGGWHFPLFKTTLLNAPHGANIAFTNSLPLVAFFLKPLRGLFPHGFHYFGAWFVFSYVLQAISSVLLIRTLGQRTLIAMLSAASLALMMPTFLWQADPVALSGHGYLLLALFLYFRGIHNLRLFSTTNFHFTLLLSVVLLTNPYMISLVGTVYIAFLGDYFLYSHRDSRVCMIELAKTSIILLSLMAICGYFGQSAYAGGYKYFPVKLFSPFYGHPFTPRVLYASGGVYKKFNYLGFGLMFALTSVLVYRGQWTYQFIKRYRILTFMVCLLLSMAIYERVFFGPRVVHYDLFYPARLMGEIFRASGRMFWLFSYVLMTIGLLGLLRLENKEWAATSIFILLALQFYDTRALRYHIQRMGAQRAGSYHVSWNRLMRSVRAVHVYPAYGCQPVRNIRNHSQSILFFQGLASKYGRPINTAYATRGNCNIKQAAFRRPLLRGHLYVVTKESQAVPATIGAAMSRGWCRKTNLGTVCVPHTSQSWWQYNIRMKSTYSQFNNAPNWIKSFTQGIPMNRAARGY